MRLSLADTDQPPIPAGGNPSRAVSMARPMVVPIHGPYRALIVVMGVLWACGSSLANGEVLDRPQPLVLAQTDAEPTDAAPAESAERSATDVGGHAPDQDSHEPEGPEASEGEETPEAERRDDGSPKGPGTNSAHPDDNGSPKGPGTNSARPDSDRGAPKGPGQNGLRRGPIEGESPEPGEGKPGSARSNGDDGTPKGPGT